MNFSRMPTSMKYLIPLMVFAGCADSVEEPPPPAAAKSKPSSDGNLLVPDPSTELSTDEVRQMIPLAASLSRQEFSEILNSPPVKIGEIKNQSLTALLLAVDPLHARKQNTNAIADFQYLTASGLDPDPKLIQAAIQGGQGTEFVSVIQPEHITKCACLNRGDTATGHVEYRAGNVYAGSADFTAKRQGDHWEIVAFQLPEYRLVTNRQPDGTWRLQSEEQLLGIALP